MIDQKNIKRNSGDFSFADTLGNLINNYQWGEGYRDFQTGNKTNKSYLWSVLSSIGNDYAEVIYENVLNYIDNASNVDLCKIKALKSMATILGVKYQIFDNIEQIPIEILNLLDILSVNKKYLLDNKTFVKTFRNELSSAECLLQGDNPTLSDDIQDLQYKLDQGELKLETTYIDEDNYKKFLKALYNNCLQKFIYMQYADSENGLSTSSDKQYIYEYISESLLGIKSTTDEIAQDQYDQKIAQLKTKYKIGKDFDPIKIVDDVENFTDYFDNYSLHEQEVLSVEVQRRSDTYSSERTYNSDEVFLGYNLTRYSYYREKKVREYFDFVQKLYNNLITKADIESATKDNPSKIISQYDKDPDYFKIDQSIEETLISYDRDTDSIFIQSSMIIKIAELLQQQTLEIVGIREQLKVQLQKQYMKGTFLLLSYVINEFLKYNISNKYGDDIYDLDGSITLKEILDKTLTNGNNVELIEYEDSTEYFNIKNDIADLSAQDGKTVNQKYWDNDYNKIGVNTNDIPLEEISAYYIKQLQLDKRDVTDTTEFLSILFELGADSSFIDDKTSAFMYPIGNGSYSSSFNDTYQERLTVFNQYSGKDLSGQDPFYNYKNLAHSSYQIHPYLYNFVEQTNVVYPVANTFFQAFSEKYEQELIDLSIDNLIGPFGNVINLWKNQMYDWTGYRSLYEAKINQDVFNSKSNEQINFTGIFYPPALKAYLDNPESFIQKVKDNDKDSFYFHLNLTKEQREKIADQLLEYEKPIRLITQKRIQTEENLNDGYLSGEYDIYKYGQDAYGNSIALLKSYRSLYEKNKDNPQYSPSFNEKKNTCGELWMRIKNHPIAFPAFDLRVTYDDISQYNIKAQLGKKGKALNDYIKLLNNSYSDVEEFKDSIGLTVGKQYLRCFFDMEFEPSNRVLLLNMPYRSGLLGSSDYQRAILSKKLRTYANSSVLVASLEQDFDYQLNINVYSFTRDTYGNVDNITNPGMVLVKRTDIGETIYSTAVDKRFDFIGFSRGSSYIYCLFIERKFSSQDYYKSQFPSTKDGRPSIKIRPYGYKYHTNLYKPTADLVISDVKYNLFDKSAVKDAEKDLYEYADSIVTTCDGENLTLAYVSEYVQPVPVDWSPIKGTTDPYNKNNTQVISFTEYSNVVENYSLEKHGTNTDYPRSTAILQTDDDTHTVIYNSFDSFTSYIVMAQFKITGRTIRYSKTKYFNLNTDIGFIPVFADECGSTRFSSNSALSGQSQYNLQLLGPEKAEANATPVIIDVTDEKYGRVTEDYKEYNKFISYNKDELIIPANHSYTSYTFELSDVLSSIYDTVKETNQLVKYKYLLMNSNYIAIPIAKGGLDSPTPTSCFYNGAETYDILSGEEIIGPNGVSYQNVGSSNHINNISSIDVNVNYDLNTLLPKSISMKCNVRNILTADQKIDAGQFQLMVYNKNNVKSYDFYHLFENPNSNASSIIDDQLSGMPYLMNQLLDTIDFAQISSLSNYFIPGTTIYPFRNYAIGKKVDQMSALLEFKYSEDNVINREFPYLDSEDIEDEITIVTNDSQYIYYFSLDNFYTIDKTPFVMEKYVPSTQGTGKYVTVDVNIASGKYEEFFNKALTIQASYNIEVVDSSKVDEDSKPLPGYYGVVLYFNYKNYSEPPYINYTRGEGNNKPTWSYCQANDESIKTTYLVLKPGQSGKLDLRVDYLEFDKLNPSDISQSVVGKTTKIVKTYYILNSSQDKPKFKISRKPFSL